MRELTERDEESIYKLDNIQKHLDNEICFAALDAIDLYHEEEDTIIRGFIFSQGEREEAIAIDENGYILYHKPITKKRIKPNLIESICSCLLYYLIQIGEGNE